VNNVGYSFRIYMIRLRMNRLIAIEHERARAIFIIKCYKRLLLSDIHFNPTYAKIRVFGRASFAGELTAHLGSSVDRHRGKNRREERTTDGGGGDKRGPPNVASNKQIDLSRFWVKGHRK